MLILFRPKLCFQLDYDIYLYILYIYLYIWRSSSRDRDEIGPVLYKAEKPQKLNNLINSNKGLLVRIELTIVRRCANGAWKVIAKSMW